MTDDDKALVYRMRNLQVLEYPHDRIQCADRIEALSAENERLRKELSGISGRLKVMREALIHTAGICNPASGFLKNTTGVRKKHIESVCSIACAALGDTK